jgi:hypothetical protein
MKRKNPSTQPNASAAKSFIKLASNHTGRQLYEQEHKDEINAEATARRKDGKVDGHAGFYQAVLKEMWEAEGEREEYEKRAEEAANNISQFAVFLIVKHLF